MNRIDELSDTALLKEVGRRIANLRISAKMKQEELAAKSHLSPEFQKSAPFPMRLWPGNLSQ